MTSWADIIAAAMVLIDDVRLEEQLSVSPAQFYRRMVGWVNLAYPRLNKPDQLRTYLSNGKSDPKYDDFLWTSTEESVTQEIDVDTGMIGYELCSVTVRIQHPNNTISLLPYQNASYDAETGIVTFPQQAQVGIDYDIDFYTDGSFPDLTDTQMRLIALAIATLWDDRFSRNWLAMGPKLHDDNFNAPNESQFMEKASKRLKENIISFNDELKDYEQRCAYHAVLKNQISGITLL